MNSRTLFTRIKTQFHTFSTKWQSISHAIPRHTHNTTSLSDNTPHGHDNYNLFNELLGQYSYKKLQERQQQLAAQAPATPAQESPRAPTVTSNNPHTLFSEKQKINTTNENVEIRPVSTFR